MNNYNNITNSGLILVDYLIECLSYINSIYALSSMQLSYKVYIFCSLIIYETQLLNTY